MKFGFLALCSLLFWATQSVRANVLTLLPSTQSVTFTGTGANAQGAGTGVFSWGACTYDGKNSTCTVSGNYTGLGNGGTYAFVLSYPGNGMSPLTGVANPPGSNNVLFHVAVGSFQFFITPSGGSQIQFFDFNDSLQFSPTTAVCTVVTTCAVGAVGLTAGSSITGPINGNFDVTPTLRTSQGVISASAYGAFNAIAPGTWMELYGTNLGTILKYTWAASDFNGAQAPTGLAGTTVTVGGKPAFIDFVSPEQVNAQVPTGISTGPQPVVITTAGGTSIINIVVVNATEPGLLAPAAFNLAAGQYIVALFPDGTTFALPPGVVAGVPTAQPKPGQVVMLYGVGFGAVSPAIDAGLIEEQSNALSGFQIAIGGVPATVQFAGEVAGFVGLYQFNVVIPQLPANNATPVAFTLNGAPGAQSFVIPIGN